MAANETSCEGRGCAVPPPAATAGGRSPGLVEPRAIDPAEVLIIGCGNLLRSDDGVGPVLIRRLLERGLPPGVQVADGGTAGMDVAFRMRGTPHVVLVDACSSGGEPGAIYELPGHQAETPPLEACGNLHSFRWDHAIAFARWLLKDDFPRTITVFLIEAETVAPGMELSAPVRRGMDELVELLVRRYTNAPTEARACVSS